MSSISQIDTVYVCSKCYGRLNVNADFNIYTNDLLVWVSPCENCFPNENNNLLSPNKNAAPE